MKVVVLFLAMIVGVVAGQDQKVFGKSEEASFEGKVVRIKIGEKDLSNGQSFKFWERTLERAVEEGAKGIVFDLDTPGGLAFPTEEFMSTVAELPLRTVAYVNPKAMSAGSLISVSTDEIYMAPGSKIGSSGLVNSMGEIDPVMRAKLESYFSAQVRYIMKKKNHRIEVMEAMMLLSDEERTIGDVVVKPGHLLALNSTEAVKMMDDGPLLAKAEMDSIEDVLRAEGWSESDMVTAEPTGFEKFAWWVASISGILILVGLAGGYFEMKTPGFGIGGVVCLVAFALFFFGNYMAGKMAGYEMAAIFVLGLILIAVEIFVIPGFGVFGIVGLILSFGSLLYSMVDRVQWRNYEWSGEGVIDAWNYWFSGGDVFDV